VYRRTYPNLVDLYIKLKVFFFYQEHKIGGENLHKTKKGRKKNVFLGDFFFFKIRMQSQILYIIRFIYVQIIWLSSLQHFIYL
jgi:hypothetical protein